MCDLWGNSKLKRDALRKAYKEARLNLNLTLRDAARLLDISPAELVKIEVEVPEIRVDKTQTITVKCGYCREPMQTHPIVSPPMLFPMYVCPKCDRNMASET